MALTLPLFVCAGCGGRTASPGGDAGSVQDAFALDGDALEASLLTDAPANDGAVFDSSVAPDATAPDAVASDATAGDAAGPDADFAETGPADASVDAAEASVPHECSDAATGIVTLVTGQPYPWGIAVGDGWLFWSSGSTVAKVSLDGCTAAVISNQENMPRGIVVVPPKVFWADYGSVTGGSIGVASLDGGSAASASTGTIWTPDDIASDGVNLFWTNNSGVSEMEAGAGPFRQLGFGDTMGIATDGVNVYWSDWNPQGDNTPRDVWAVPIGGGPSEQRRIAFSTNPMFVATDGVDVYWTDYTDGLVLAAPVGANAADAAPPTVLASNQGKPLGIATDGVSVYWTNGGSGTVMRVATGGGTPVTLATGQDTPGRIAIDSTSVYWLTGASVDAVHGQVGNADGGVVKLTPK